MKHAQAAALDKLEPLLERLRQIVSLKEKSRGVFYLRSKAFLHFHEDPAGLFADIRTEDGRDFERVLIDGVEAEDALVSAARARAGA